MKKMMFVFLVLISMISLTACSQSEDVVSAEEHSEWVAYASELENALATTQSQSEGLYDQYLEGVGTIDDLTTENASLKNQIESLKNAEPIIIEVTPTPIDKWLPRIVYDESYLDVAKGSLVVSFELFRDEYGFPRDEAESYLKEHQIDILKRGCLYRRQFNNFEEFKYSSANVGTSRYCLEFFDSRGIEIRNKNFIEIRDYELPSWSTLMIENLDTETTAISVMGITTQVHANNNVGRFLPYDVSINENEYVVEVTEDNPGESIDIIFEDYRGGSFDSTIITDTVSSIYILEQGTIVRLGDYNAFEGVEKVNHLMWFTVINNELVFLKPVAAETDDWKAWWQNDSSLNIDVNKPYGDSDAYRGDTVTLLTQDKTETEIVLLDGSRHEVTFSTKYLENK